MADVKWIKLAVDMFEDEKIVLIETLPESESILLVWIKLLCLAGKQNNSGVFILNNKIPYNAKMFATIFRMKETTVELALSTFQNFGMIEIINDVVTIPNWGKHQNLDSIEKKRESQKLYMREYRAKQKALLECKANSKANSKANVSSLELEEEKEKEKDKDKELDNNTLSNIEKINNAMRKLGYAEAITAERNTK